MTWKIQAGQNVPDFNGDMANQWNPMFFIGYTLPLVSLDISQPGKLIQVKTITSTWATVDHLN